MVMIHGAPMSIESVVPSVAAVVDAHYPGEQGGIAIYNVLSGAVSPAGRLTTTMYPATITTDRPTIADMSVSTCSLPWGTAFASSLFVPLWVARNQVAVIQQVAPGYWQQSRSHVPILRERSGLFLWVWPFVHYIQLQHK